MKILVLTIEPPYPPFNGVRIKTYHVLKGLFERGHEIHLISFAKDSSDFKPDVIDELSKYCVSIRFFRLYDDPKWLIKNVVTGLHKKDVILFRFKSKDFMKALLNTVKNETIDLAHFDTISLTPYIEFVNELVPSVASVNDSYSLWLRGMLSRKPYPTWGSLLEKMYYTVTFPSTIVYEKIMYEKFQKVHVVSEIDGTYLRNLNSRIDVEVIPNGVDTGYFKPQGLPQNEKSLVFVASMISEQAYNAIWFIRKIFVKLKRNIPDIKLYIVGRDPDPMLLSEARRTKGIIVTGYVNDVRPYIDKATLIIDPNTKICGILNHILQSMAMGKAVVGTRSGFLAIKGAKNWKNVVVADDEKDFVSNIIHLLENVSDRKTIGANARQLMEREYSWKKIIPKYEKMYENAIEKFEK